MCEHRKILFSPNKLNYAQGDRPDVDCILCAARDCVEGVDQLIVFRDERFFITLNLFPYNPGHLMIAPNRHLESLEELTDDEVYGCHRLQLIAIKVLRLMYNPQGFNLGYNIGQFSGASISHLHFHVVPRYSSEVGFMDVINGARIIVEEPVATRERMREKFELLVRQESN
tara:strand:+ start:1634 stop:2146 length:513 start_codon:yes stop_codon:yes gene_type:complete